MPRRRYSDDEPRSGLSLASGALRALGQGLCFATLGLSIATMTGWSSSVDIGTVLTAGALGTSALLSSAAIRSVEGWKREAEDGNAPQSIGIGAQTISMAVPGPENDDLVAAELQADHVSRLGRERAQREASSGRVA